MKLLTASEVAERFNVPETWVRKTATRGALPHIKLGKYLRFDEGAIEAYLRERSS